jgi:hypothetical protein
MSEAMAIDLGHIGKLRFWPADVHKVFGVLPCAAGISSAHARLESLSS